MGLGQGLQKIIDRLRAHGLGHVGKIRVAGEHDEHHLRVEAADALHQLRPVHDGHAYVGEHDVAARRFQLFQCLLAVERQFLDAERLVQPLDHPLQPSLGVRLVLDGKALVSGDFSADAPCRLEQDVLVHKVKRGHLSVSLRGTAAGGEADAFLPTESELLGALAKHVGWIIAKREALATRRNLERQLQHADRLAKIGQFAAGVAHELNEPLANILGFAQLAAQTPGLPDQAARDLDNIVKSALHSREVIKKLMIFGRQVPLQKTLVDLNQVIRDSLYFIEMSASRGKVEVRTELAEGLPAIMADPQHLKQVIVNLVVNGIHAMPGGGVLTMQTQSFNDDVYLLVSDTGVGMAPEVLRQIFNPFFTTKDVDQGTGLGLAVVHGIVHAHGGIIEVESETGRGTRFEITFPCSHGLPKNQDSDDK